MDPSSITPSSSQQAVIALNAIADAYGSDPNPSRFMNNSVTNAKLAQVAQSTIKGRLVGSGAGSPVDLTAGQATAIIDVMVADSGSGGVKGLIGAPAAGDAAAHKFWGAGATWATALVRSSSQSTSSGTTADFSSIPAWARKITCVFADLSLDGFGHLLVQIGDSGGLETTGYVSTSLVTDSAPLVLSVSSTSGYIAYLGGAANVIQGELTLCNITGDSWVVTGFHSFTNSGTIVGISAGSKSLSGTLDRLRFTVTANQFDAGTVNIVYE